MDHAIGRSPLYWSYDVAAEGLSRSEPSFRTAPLVGRFDLRPTLSLPLVLHGWSVRPELSLRETFYTQQLIPSSGGVGVAESDVINRRAIEGSVEIRPPALERVYDREFLGRKWKHVIEPRAIYRYVTGVDNFSRILRFDERDILSNTSEVEYAVVNRLYAKRTSEKPGNCDATGMASLIIGHPAAESPVPWERQLDRGGIPCQSEPRVREVVTWELGQKYFLDPTFGGALVPGQRNVFTTTADFTGIAFLTRHQGPSEGGIKKIFLSQFPGNDFPHPWFGLTRNSSAIQLPLPGGHHRIFDSLVLFRMSRSSKHRDTRNYPLLQMSMTVDGPRLDDVLPFASQEFAVVNPLQGRGANLIPRPPLRLVTVLLRHTHATAAGDELLGAEGFTQRQLGTHRPPVERQRKRKRRPEVKTFRASGAVRNVGSLQDILGGYVIRPVEQQTSDGVVHAGRFEAGTVKNRDDVARRRVFKVLISAAWTRYKKPRVAFERKASDLTSEFTAWLERASLKARRKTNKVRYGRTRGSYDQSRRSASPRVRPDPPVEFHPRGRRPQSSSGTHRTFRSAGRETQADGAG